MRFRALIKLILYIQISFTLVLGFNTGFAQQSKTIEHWQQITDKNPKDKLAWFNIGVLYEKGQGVQQNLTKAQQSYTKSINLGYAPAMFNLGSIYSQKKDYANAKFWWERAAKQGVPEAQYNLATLYEKGWGVKQNPEKAALWYQRAAETAMQKYLELYQYSKEKLRKQSAINKTSVGFFDRFSFFPVAQAANKSDYRKPDLSINTNETLIEMAQAELKPDHLSGWPWIYSQPSENFTIQLFATKEESKTAKFIQQYALTDRTQVIPAIVKGTQYYKVVLGSFAEWNDAAVEIGALPQDLRDERPWVRKFSTLYPELPEGTNTTISQVVAEQVEVDNQVKLVEPEQESEIEQTESIQQQPKQEIAAVEASEMSESVSSEVDETQTESVEQADEEIEQNENGDQQQTQTVSLDKEEIEIKSRMPEKKPTEDQIDDVFTIYAKRQLDSNGLSEPIKEQLQAGLEYVRSSDYSQAFEQLSPLATAGLPEAQFRLSLLYAEGKGVGLDLTKAFEYAKLSAEQGHPYGQRLLAEFYDNGIGVETNTGLAAYWQQTGDDNIKKLEDL